ncbi:hypothetical protein HD806DRAFT_525817 [Xylariaceae sp. AK1471]|nr:hypothetical protein HD806DRAFT_525817 [Xylariaceae sp. AK1471]
MATANRERPLTHSSTAKIGQQAADIRQELTNSDVNKRVLSNPVSQNGPTVKDSAGNHDECDLDEFPPIDEVSKPYRCLVYGKPDDWKFWARIMEQKKQRGTPSESPTVTNSPTLYKDYLRQETDPTASGSMQISPKQAGSRTKHQRRKRKNKGRQMATRRSKRIKALQLKQGKRS